MGHEDDGDTKRLTRILRSVLVRELKKPWNMKMTVIIVTGAFGTVTKGLIQGRGLRNKRTSGDHQNTVLLRS